MNSTRTKYPALTITFLAALALVNFTVAAHADDVRMPDKVKILTAYGFKGGAYDTNNKVVEEISFGTSTDNRLLDIDGDRGFADSPEEFITAVYFTPVTINAGAQKIVDSELPRNKEGALRLCSMWLLKTAEYPENAGKYRDAIGIIKQKAGEKFGVQLTDSEIRTYYADAIKKKVYETPIRLLAKDEQDRVRELLMAYLLEPTEKNAYNFRNFVQGIRGFEPKKGGEIVAFVEKISPELCGNIV